LRCGRPGDGGRREEEQQGQASSESHRWRSRGSFPIRRVRRAVSRARGWWKGVCGRADSPRLL
jgi:hypothetical protein